MWAKAALVLSCEHGGNRVPARYRRHFAGQEERLASHAGWDLGALQAARLLQRLLGAPLCFSTTTRLLVDLNRSLHHPRVLSDISAALSAKQRKCIIDRYYRPYREQVHATVLDLMARHRKVIHVSVHSFTPSLNGRQRNADIGLLYDPGRAADAALCREVRAELRHTLPDARIRMNYPYRGNMDGLTTSLRKELSPTRYIGIELEFNQRQFAGNGNWTEAVTATAAALQTARRQVRSQPS